MIEINSISNMDSIKSMQDDYLSKTTAPLDGMWSCAFVPMADHFSVHLSSELIGYFCINDEGYILQYHLKEEQVTDGSQLLENIVKGTYKQLPHISGAFVSTAEPSFLSYCFDCFKSFKVNALMYQLLDIKQDNEGSDYDELELSLRAIQIEDHKLAVKFVLSNLDLPEEWLSGYFTNLITRQELFGCWSGEILIGTGENRKFDNHQSDFTELGVIVDQHHRKKGVATWILKSLVKQALDNKLKPICSTESDNLSAQKAIRNAGFESHNRIVQFI